MKILILVDKPTSAIARLAFLIKKYNSHLKIDVQSLHPKRPDIEELEVVKKKWDEADLVQVSYWRSGEKFRELYPESFKKKRKFLCHYNPYDVYKKDWLKDYKAVIVGNEEIHTKIPYAYLIPYCIDLDFWRFNFNYTKEKVVNMVAARIEGKKGIREVAKACKELGYKFILVGRISDPDYFRQVMEANPKTEFKENISDKELREVYYKSAVHVCNSSDNFESGTLPILEAMATGVPVLTRLIGHVPDLYDGDNMIIREGKQDDYEDLKGELRQLMDNLPLREKIREKAWQTVKNRPAEKMARQFSNLYYKLLSEKKPWVSVIIPTFDRPDILFQCLAKAVAQDYAQKEIIVVDSGNQSVEVMVKEFRNKTEVPIKYIRFDNKGEYTLAKARNLGIIKAQGRYLVFCDERIGMEKEAISAFIERIDSKVWLYGIKDNARKGFVENFSCVSREDIIQYGMFNERIDCYGGMSQEIGNRFGKNGFVFEIVPKAKARGLAESKNSYVKRQDIIRAKLINWELYEQ